MKLVSIRSLVGQNVNGRKADIRCRNADGTLRYADLPGQEKPIIVKMKHVEEKMAGPCCGHSPRGEPKIPWLYWYWDGHSCGYSGTTIEADNEEPTYFRLYG